MASETDVQDTGTRVVDGVQMPAPGTFKLDPTHSHVGFSVRHMMIAKVKGEFTGVDGTLEVAEDPARSSIEVDIDASSIDTRDEQRDGHLKSPDFLDVEQNPSLIFRSGDITPAGGDRWHLNGDLTIHGVTKPVSLNVTFEGLAQDPWGNQRVGFTAEVEIDREDFGLTWNQALETGGVLVGKQVRIDIEAEFVRQ